MERIGRYEILEELGRGAMGAVYKARDPQIGRTVAIKMILTANLSPEELQQYKQRFYREAQAAGQMSHPGIVTIHDIAEDETGQPYLVMEFVEGTTLDKLLTPKQPGLGGERLPLEQSLDIVLEVAKALDYAHRRGVIHRDIKPANMLITQDGRAKIADFGIAKLAGTQLTQAGQILGTPAFMSPEQFSGAAVDARSDLFSLGAMLYWMCTGEKPFAGDTFTAVSFKVVYSEPIPAAQLNPALPAALDLVLSRCLAKNPDDRYPTGRDLAADLEALKAGRPVAAAALPGAAQAEKTFVRPVPVAARPVEAAPLEKTVSQTATLGRAATAAIAPRAGIPAGAAKLWARLRERRLAAGIVAGLLLLMLLAGYWFWPSNAAESSAPRSVETSRRAADSGPPPWAKASSRARQPAPKPVAMSTLRIDCQHNFRLATLEIFADDKPLLEATLRGEEQDLGVVKIAQGTLRTSTALPAGQHVLRVRVTSRRDGYRDEEEIGGTFPEGGSRTLVIEFGKGSAFGVIERKLTLRWR